MSQKSELRITDLKVADLRSELDKRGLDKSGVKSVLLERLRNALQNEGIDPDQHEFHSDSKAGRNSKRKCEVEVNLEMEEDNDTNDTSQTANEEDSVSLSSKETCDTPCKDECDSHGKDESDSQGKDDNVNQSKDDSDIQSNDDYNNQGKDDHETKSKNGTNGEDEYDSQVIDDSNSEGKDECDSQGKDDCDDQDKDNYDVLCSDEEMDDIKCEVDDTDSGRFRTTTPSAEEHPSPVEDITTSDVQNTQISESSDIIEVVDDKDQSPIKKYKLGKGVFAEYKSGKKYGKLIANQPTVPSAKTLWVTGIKSTAKVSELKALFSKHGKVIFAKVLRSTKGSQKWYGLLTMATTKDASKCIEKLHRTEFAGHIISVERRQVPNIVKKSLRTSVKKQPAKAAKNSSVAKSDNHDKEQELTEEGKTEESEVTKGSEEKEKSDDESRNRSRSYEDRPAYRGRHGRFLSRRPFGFRGRGTSFRGRFRYRRPFGRSQFSRPGFRPFNRGSYRFDFNKGRVGRFPRRDYRDRGLRQDEDMRQRSFVQHKQKEEAYRLEREKNQLRFEREMLEREKAEMFKFDRIKRRGDRERMEVGYTSERHHGGSGQPHVWVDRRRSSHFDFRSSSFHRENRDHSNYKRPDFHRDIRRGRDERRDVPYGTSDHRPYSRNEFRESYPGTSSELKRFDPRNRPPEGDWKHHEQRNDGKPRYGQRGQKRMGYYQ